MTILATDGLDGLTMRRVAEALGTGPASLYAHVDDKSDLLSICVDRAISEVELPEPDPERWQEQFVDLGRRMRAMFARHRNLARATMGMIPTGEGALRVMEWMIGLLRAAGLPDQAVAYACDLLPLYVGAVAFEDGLWPPDADPQAYFAQIGEYFAGLPADRYPNVTGMVGALLHDEGDARFEFGLTVLVTGLAAMADRS